ncbi:hypothetical protein B566_EDAN010258 [Ephemera danica]|nr:hypothetical protein B566_EDAN010258 [Ephemera danica]
MNERPHCFLSGTMKLALAVFLVVALTMVHGQDTRPIWKHYKTTLLANPEAMRSLYNCIFAANPTCTPVEQQVKDVFRENFLNNCASCCSFRRNMVREIMEYFTTNGFSEIPLTSEVMGEVLSPEYYGN